MLAKLNINIASDYKQYTMLLLVISLFLGNAPLSIAFVIFIASCLIQVIINFKIKSFFSNKLYLLMSSYFIINIVIIVLLADKLEDVLEIQRLLPFIILPIIFTSLEDVLLTEKLQNLAYKTFIYTAFVTFLISFSYAIFRVFYWEGKINFIYLTYKHFSELFGVVPIYLSLFYLFAFVLCLEFLKSEKPKQIYMVIGVSLITGIVLLSSRTALLLLGIIIIIKGLTGIKSKLKSTVLVLSTLLLAIILIFTIPTLKNRVVNFNQNISSYSGLSLRSKIWKNSIEVFKESPIYGFGIKKSQIKLQSRYKEVNFRRAYINNFNSHNQYLQTMIDSGFLGFVFLILMLFYPLIYLKTIKSTQKLFIFIIVFSLVTESMFIRQNGIIFYCLFICLLLAENKKD